MSETTHWIKCPRDGYTWQTRSKLAHVTCPSCRYKVNLKENIVDDAIVKMRHFNLDEHGIRILDPSLATNNNPNGRIIDVFFKQGQAWCNYDQSADCKHVEFALSLDVV